MWSSGARRPTPDEDDENGGISGMVMYAVTRAEDDPELAAAEPWEPGIPGVTVNLYDCTVQSTDGSAIVALLATTKTDSWDDSLPTNCQGRQCHTRRPRVANRLLRRHAQLEPGAPGCVRRRLCLRKRSDWPGGRWKRLADQRPFLPASTWWKWFRPPVTKSSNPRTSNVDFGDTYFPSPGAAAAAWQPVSVRQH